MDPAGGGGGRAGFERACRLPNTVHSEIAPALPLPTLPPALGFDGLRDDEPLAAPDRPDMIMQAANIARILAETDVSHLGFTEADNVDVDPIQCSWLWREVLKHNPDAFKVKGPTPPPPSQGSLEGPKYQNQERGKHFEHLAPNLNKARKEPAFPLDDIDTHREHFRNELTPDSVASKKPKVRKKEINNSASRSGHSIPNSQEVIANFCEMVEDFCGRAEIPDDADGGDWLSIPLNDVKVLVNEITSIRSKRILHEVPMDTITRLLHVIDRQIRCSQGLSIDVKENPDAADAEPLVFSTLESIHAALAIMTHHDMPKQLYQEELIERILDFSRHQIMDCMAASNPTFRALYKPAENVANDGDDDEDDMENGPVSKKRRTTTNLSMRKSSNRVSASVYSAVQKLCLILGFLKELLTTVRLSDSCILQLAKTCFTTFLVDSMQLLQLKAIGVICTVFSSYTQHRSYLVDETLHLLRKLQFSRNAVRTYHLADEEQKQIQMITALLVHLVQFSAIVPDSLKGTVDWSTIIDASVDTSYPIKCHEAATEACCLFWTNVLQRFTAAKSQDTSEAKGIIDNLVQDLLTMLNLPEYPAAASILEVLCVLLLQNAGLKSKDTSARCFAIDLLGGIASRLKRDAVTCSREKLWILQEVADAGSDGSKILKNKCCVCLGGRGINIACDVCGRCFHSDCFGAGIQDNLQCDSVCPLCSCKQQLSVLQSYCQLQIKENGKRTAASLSKKSGTPAEVPAVDIVQQILLSYLQEAGQQDDGNLFTRWFYLCMWYKDDPHSQEKIIYYLARLKSKEILRDSGNGLVISRDWAKKICLALGQKNSFSRGFDKILSLLLASLRENSPVIRAKALRAVSGIVEADPEVLGDKRVQSAVEGRFCDSAISVREAALELVGRHIASHPDVGLKYIEKVAERIKDTGVSVRKRAIKIIRDLCASNPNTDTTHAFVEIISRVNDEESSVQDLVCKTFYELWFEEPTGSHKHLVADGSSVPLEIAQKTEQIVDMLRKMPNHQPLITIIKRNLNLDFLPQSTKAAGINSSIVASLRKCCELICQRLLERILQVEEGAANEMEVHALPYIVALQAFCIVDPTLCIPVTDPSQFVVTLQPYLKIQVDNKSAAQLLESIIFVIDAVLPLLRKPPQTVVVELEQDLKQMIVRHSFLTVVHACIKCLCALSKSAGRGPRLLEYLVNVFYKHLYGTNSDGQLLGRSLFCLGLLLRYGYQLMLTSENQLDFAKIIDLLKRRYLIRDDFSLKVRALQTLGYILIAKPEFMLQKHILDLIEASLSSGVDHRLKIQGLQNLYEYLRDAESQLTAESTGKPPAEYATNGGSEVPVAAGAGDTNICGGIIQLYWSSILERCLDINDQVRQSALKIVEVVLRQGLVHPITCVPHLIALETDPLEGNSKLAHHLLMNMNEKYPSFFESRLGDGLQMSFRFFETTVSNHKIAASMKSNPIAFVKPGISRIYRLIRANRNSRNKFVHSIVRKFESDGRSRCTISFLVYCAEVLASLPFTCPDEPLYLIYDINRIIHFRAGAVEANLKRWTSMDQHQDMVGMSTLSRDSHIMHEPGGYSDHYVGDVSERMHNNPCSMSDVDTAKLQEDCHDAIALQLLLKLKRHLKTVYSLTDARCQAFSLKELPKSGETLSKQNVPFNISSTNVSLPSCLQDVARVYQDFKTSLREDSMDFGVYTATVQRKRPTPRSSSRVRRSATTTVTRGRGGGGGDDDDTDDEDWTGGARVLDFSAQASNGGRITRQRVQV
ncbi:sister chromatid cohesion protein SCC2-like isoform X1 [Phragmites australis]|uniref:sister chromatid cohesion protein SCC2-like isoform X1 n=1 Tax=Phragmites australis TaxID=29695 RepID=UPI002D78CFC4|nr:sister chromatid cohesion protein SCC2-like isoform X1 [Phragmites australis]